LIQQTLNPKHPKYIQETLRAEQRGDHVTIFNTNVQQHFQYEVRFEHLAVTGFNTELQLDKFKDEKCFEPTFEQVKGFRNVRFDFPSLTITFVNLVLENKCSEQQDPDVWHMCYDFEIPDLLK
jgi:hypothetical protein